MRRYILVMDQGTTGSRGVVYDEQGKLIAFDYEEYEQFYPHSGWWEQNGKIVWDVTLRMAQSAVKKRGLQVKISLPSVLPTRERQQRCGIRRQVSRLRRPSSGAAVGQRISVRT